MRGVLVSAATLVLGGSAAGSALASFNPRLAVIAPAGAVTIALRIDPADDPAAKVAVYVPRGYQVRTPAPGTRLGAAAGRVVAPVAGDVVVGDPKSFAADQARCVGTETVDAVWVVHLSGLGVTLDLPVFVVRTSGGEAVLGPSKLVLCPPPTTRLVDLTFAVSALTSPAAGEYRWRSLSTPYAPGTAQPDPAGTREAQAIVRVPTRLTIAVERSKVVTRTSAGRRTWTRLTITGELTENGAGIRGRPVVLRSGSGGVVVATTSSDGVYRKTVLTRRAVSIVATSTIPARDLGASGCTATFGPVPCTSATIAASSVTSRKVRAAAFRFK